MDNALDSHDSVGIAELVKKRKVSPAELLETAVARARADGACAH